jgi:hypothetical protein
MHSNKTIGDQWKNILCLGHECYEDVDYDENGKAILPPLTSLFQNNEIAKEITPISPWNFGHNNINHPLTPEDGTTFDDKKFTCIPDGATEDDVNKEIDKTTFGPEGAVQQTISVPERVSHNSQTEIFADNDITATGRPRQNVGTYKQGPAKIWCLPVVREEYDFSFSVISD